MKRFADERTELVYRTGFADDVPEHVAHQAGWYINLLLAAHEVHDIGVIGPIARWANSPGRLGIHVDAKWYVTFEWDLLAHAKEIRLERR